MAWVRTATSLISFGFTIYKAFEYLRQRQPDVADGVLGPRNFALVLIGLGIGALVLATVQHRGDLRRLEAQYGALPRSTAAIVATVVSLLGILALILVFLRQ
jgi:putative membrane protein